MKIRLSENETLVLRTSNTDGTSRNNFKWPKRGPVKCPDWRPTKKCGNGLHGALMGEGDGDLFNWEKNALWQVVRVNKNEIIDLDGKVKFPKGFVVYSGDRKTATDIIYKNGGKAVIGGTQIVGNGRFATTGYRGTTTTGDYGTVTAGNYGNATAGKYGIAIAEYEGTATVGDNGTATAGHYGTATAGEYGVAIAGIRGKCRVGINGQISIYYLDKNNRLRTKIGYVGENGLEPDVFYRLDNNANFVKVDA